MGSAWPLTAAPETIHDFGGFPQALYDVQYPAPGDPGLARRVHALLAPVETDLSEAWGLDHGTWSVLRHAYPDAEVPVVQLSIDGTRPAAYHYELGRRLAALREEGVLILGSGNIVHNFRAYVPGQDVGPYPWAAAFDERVRESVQSGDHAPLIGYEKLGRDAALAVPTPDHYLPLLYVLGAGLPDEAVTFPVDGFEGGSMSMLAVQLG